MRNLSFKKKVLMTFLISFFVSHLLVNNLFIANSPKVRSDLKVYLASRIKGGLEHRNFLPLFKEDSQTAMPNTQVVIKNLKDNLKPLSKGVMAASDNNSSYIKYDLDEVEWVEYVFTLKDGRTIKVEVPKGQEPPPKEIFE